jgi:PiT family inorganic phosphate transporter
MQKRAERGFRWAQIGSSSMVALAHGTNDAQKTMGVISLVLISNGDLAAKPFSVPTWVIVSCAAAIALGTYMGGWRIIKTLGSNICEVRSPQGFSSETVAATTILVSSHFGYPLSTTQVVSGAVTGSGIGRRTKVNWGTARRIVGGWILTLPAAGATGAVVYAVLQLFGTNKATGPIVVSVVFAIGCFFLWRASQKSNVDPDSVVAPEDEPPPPSVSAPEGAPA